MYNLRKTTNGNNFLTSPSVIKYPKPNNEVGVDYCPYAPGLGFWLDGIYKGNTSGAWTDLIGGVIFTNYSSSIPVVSNNNHWYFASGASMVNSTATLNFPYASSTFEITYKMESAVASTIFVPKTSNTVAFGHASSTAISVKTGGSGLTIKSQAYPTDVCTTSFIYNSTIIGNIILAGRWNDTSSNNSWTIDSAGNNVIGMRPGQANSKFVGRIYCIRIYNRPLSIEEMKYNQHVDNVRFGLGLPETL